MKRKMLAIFAAITIGIVSLIGVTPAYAAEEDTCKHTVLGFKPWYSGVCENGEIVSISPEDEDGLPRFVWTIVLNILFDISLAVGYLTTGIIIYGGYLYIISQGDPGNLAKAKKTLMNGVIGTVVAISANVIVNTISLVLKVNLKSGEMHKEVVQTDIQNAFNWFYGMAGLVTVAFLIYGGFMYMISRGNPAGVQKATRTLIFSLIGLVVVILAAAITNFVIFSTGKAL